jgi:hypothetical protein
MTAKNFPALYGIRKFLTHICQWTQLLFRWIQSTSSHYISLKSILTLSCHLYMSAKLCLPSGFLTTILQMCHFSNELHVSPISSFLTSSANKIWWMSHIMMLLNTQFCPSSFYFYHQVTNNVLNILFSTAKYQVWFINNRKCLWRCTASELSACPMDKQNMMLGWEQWAHSHSEPPSPG